MKDPLQQRETPYEILGVPEDASAEDVERAFKSKLAARENAKKLMAARSSLSRPQERALVDLFSYLDAELQGLRPNPLVDAAALARENRSATGAAWLANLRSKYPNASIAHPVAVCHYWGAVWECERLCAGHLDSSTPMIESRWRVAIGAWVSLLEDPAFLLQWPRIPAEQREAVAVEVRHRIVGDLERFTRQFHKMGMSPLAELMEQLSACCEDEFETARAMSAARLSNQRGMLTGGRLLFESLGVAEDVLSAVQGALQRAPDNQNLRFLRRALSKHGSIWFLLRRNRFQEAVNTLAQITEHSVRNTPEVRSLECLALVGLGSHYADLRRWAEALATWEHALGKADDDKARASIAERVEQAMSTAMGESAAGNADDGLFGLMEKSLALLEKAKVTPSANLKAQYADRMCIRGIRAINTAQQDHQVGKIDSAQALKRVELGRVDLRKAADLGSARAAEQLPAVHEIVAVLSGHAGPRAEPAPGNPRVPAQPVQSMPTLIQWWLSLSRWVRIAVGITAGILLFFFVAHELGELDSPFLSNLFLFAIIFVWYDGVIGGLAKLTMALVVLVAVAHFVFKDRSEPAPEIAQQVEAKGAAQESKAPAPPTASTKPGPTPETSAKGLTTAADGKATKKLPPAAPKADCPKPQKMLAAATIDERTQALRTLQSIEDLGPDCRGEATLSAAGLAAKLEAQPEATRSWTTLVVAATFEAVGDAKSAVSYYERLRSDSNRTIAVTAALRLMELDGSARPQAEKYYLELLGSDTAEAWFKRTRTWEHGTTRTAANQGLLAVRAAEYSIQVFEKLREIDSSLEQRHRYLIPMLGLLLALLVLELPLIVSRARMVRKVKSLTGVVERIRQTYGRDPAEMGKQVSALYKQHGVNPATGCLMAVIEIALLCAALYFFSRWIPRLELDAAGFFWIADVLAPDEKIVFIWFGAAMLMTALSVRGTTGQKIAAAVVVPSIVTGLALYFSWPAYVMVGWTMLLILTAAARGITNRVMIR